MERSTVGAPKAPHFEEKELQLLCLKKSSIIFCFILFYYLTVYQCSTFCQKFVAFLYSSACDHYFLKPLCVPLLSRVFVVYIDSLFLSPAPLHFRSLFCLCLSLCLSLSFSLTHSLPLLSLSLSLSLSLCLPPPSLCLCLCLCLCFCLSLSLCLPLLLPPLCLSASALCLCLSLSLSVSLSACLSLSLSLSLSLFLCLSVSVSLLKSQFVASFSNSTLSTHLYSDLVYTYRSIFSHIHLNEQCFWRVSGTRACRWYPQYPHFKNMGRNSSFVSFTHKLQLHVVKSSCA